MFKAQSSEAVKETLPDFNILPVMLPKNMPHLLQTLYLIINITFKQEEKIAFSNYFTEYNANDNPTCDVTTNAIDLPLIRFGFLGGSFWGAWKWGVGEGRNLPSCQESIELC